MCRGCVKKEYPDRETICLDSGSYIVNYFECAQCNGRDGISIVNKSTHTDEEVEVTTYTHVCRSCQHEIAQHEHRFSVQDDYQEYEMECLLCGYSQDTRSVMPYDPRQVPLF